MHWTFYFYSYNLLMNINPPYIAPVARFASNEQGSIQSSDDASRFVQADLERIVEICNQELVYNMLFAEKMAGKPYSLDKAQSFVSWAELGWKDKTHFVFIIRDGRGQIAAAMDIKSPDLDNAEIGYWASADSPGYITNAVAELLKIAASVGYHRLIALTKPENSKSAGVLQRNGFQQIENVERDGKEYLQFERTL
jgi:RimJ/RimL family protein N-acetyltransferase